MIVLDHRRVPQPHAVIGRAAHPRRIFLQHPQARNRLARVEQDRASARECIDIAPRHRRDARQVLHRVQRRRSEEHTSELQSLMRTSYAVFCLKKKNIQTSRTKNDYRETEEITMMNN